jgi:hypothetical protein
MTPFWSGLDGLTTEAVGGGTESPPIESPPVDPALLLVCVETGVLCPVTTLFPQATRSAASTTTPTTALIADIEHREYHTPALCTLL